MDITAQARFAAMLHHRTQNLAPGDPVVAGIISSATYHAPDVAGLSHVYGRSGMPTWETLEAQLAMLEDADCVAFPSGMAAISAAISAISSSCPT